MVKYEYTIIQIKTKVLYQIIANINELANDGWILMYVIYDLYYFKKRIE